MFCPMPCVCFIDSLLNFTDTKLRHTKQLGITRQIIRYSISLDVVILNVEIEEKNTTQNCGNIGWLYFSCMVSIVIFLNVTILAEAFVYIETKTSRSYYLSEALN